MYYTRFDLILIQIVFYTISCDVIFLLFKFPTIRLYQCLILYLVTKFFILNYKLKIKITSSFFYLIIFAVINLFFSINSGYLPKGLGYSIWLFLNIMFVIYIVQIINKNNINLFLILFIKSQLVVSIYGLVQFFGGILGFGDYLGIVMWWIDGKLPRINAFSYEPSFMISYLIAGYVFLSYLLINKIYILNIKFQKLIYISIAFTIIISGSRMGLLLVLLWEGYQLACLLSRTYKSKHINKDIIYSYISKFVILMILIIIFYMFSDSVRLIILNGTGVMGTSDHSIFERYQGFYSILKLFTESPIIGYSLGGLSYHLSVEKFGKEPASFIDSKIEGNGVILEILAGTGIFGFIIFILFLHSLINNYKKIVLLYKDSNRLLIIFIAFSFGLLFQFLSIQPNQNILRSYLWLNLGLYLALCKIMLKEKS